MKIMIEASVYNRFKDIVISIDGEEGSGIMNVTIGRTNDNGDFFVLDGMTVDTIRQEPRG